MEILSKFIESMEKGNILIAMLIAFVALLFNYKSIIEFFDSRKKVKISKLEEILKNENIKGLDRELLENELIKEQFKSTVGLGVEKEFREAIIKAHQKTNGELRFRHFQRALPYLKYEQGTLKVSISKFEYIGDILNIVSAISLISIGYALFSYTLFNFSWTTAFQMFGFATSSIIIGFIFIYQMRHMISAKMVLKELKKELHPCE